ncbi:hypothetical protein [Halorubrum sp. DTA98]|uniref:hypothetical protein n=1 Tax=Halorubrum sp. DTA98 TaxID=3402163 RepID=UPI003AAA3AF1
MRTDVMSVGSDLQRMGGFLERFERGVGTVKGVEFVDRLDTETGPTVDVEIGISPSADRRDTALSPIDASIGDDGRFRIALETNDAVVPPAADDIDVEPTGTHVGADGTVTVTVRVSIRDGASPSTAEDRRARPTAPADGDGESVDSAGSGTAGDVDSARDDGAGSDDEDGDRGVDAGEIGASNDEIAGRERSVPPFRDPDLLAEVYESCDTFAEMSEAIEMDVTGETVRRYMIDYGIHEPNSYGTPSSDDDRRESAPTDSGDDPGDDPGDGSDADPCPPIAVTDGIGLREDVTVDALVETISRSNTVYEVQQGLELGREETRELLRELDLIDLVVGRIATEHERDIGRETILERLRQAAETEARSAVAGS